MKEKSTTETKKLKDQIVVLNKKVEELCKDREENFDLKAEIKKYDKNINYLEERIAVIQREASSLARENTALQLRLTKIEQEYLNLTVYRKRND
jgi:predicted  nucleic acid-binding Zn-ribbon protein